MLDEHGTYGCSRVNMLHAPICTFGLTEGASAAPWPWDSEVVTSMITCVADCSAAVAEPLIDCVNTIISRMITVLGVLILGL